MVALKVVQGADMITEKPADLLSIVLGEIRTGREELKALIKEEIAELKNEHIADVRKNLERLSDDQRRSWDAIRALEKREAERRGGFRAWHAIWGAAGTLIGAIAALGGAIFTKGH